MLIREEKEIKEIHIRKEEVKLSLFADDMILYIRNHKENYWSLSMNSVKLQDTKINIRNLLYFYILCLVTQS